MNMNPPLDGGPKSKREVKLYKIWDGSCILDCPANTTEHCTTENGIPKRLCSPCHESKFLKWFISLFHTPWVSLSCILLIFSERCPKICKGLMLDSVEKAKALHGCTFIAGQLEIQITAGGENAFITNVPQC